MPKSPNTNATLVAAQLILCNCPDTDSANRIAITIVKQRLAACVNVAPGLRSVYSWQGEITEAEETMLLIKTTTERYAAVEQAIVAAHPYDLPEVIAIDITAGLPAYLKWLESSVCG